MAQTIVEQAQPGDVVISMGAGSIGNVPAQVVDGDRMSLRPRRRPRDGTAATVERAHRSARSRC